MTKWESCTMPVALAHDGTNKYEAQENRTRESSRRNSVSDDQESESKLHLHMRILHVYMHGMVAHGNSLLSKQLHMTSV